MAGSAVIASIAKLTSRPSDLSLYLQRSRPVVLISGKSTTDSAETPFHR